MMTLTFPERGRALLDDCLARPYPSANARSEFVVERDANGQSRLVLTDVPTGLAADTVVEQVANDTKDGLVLGLKAIHNESSESGGTRLVFTPAPDADTDDVAADLRRSFTRMRPAIEATHSPIQAAVAGQGLVVALSRDDWYVVHGVLVDARTRQPMNGTLGEAARLVGVSLFGEEDD